MPKHDFGRGNFERYDPDPIFLTRCKSPEAVRKSAEDEKAWASVIDAHGDEHRPATLYENTRKHVDVVQKIDGKEIKYEVKGPKSLKTSSGKQDKRVLVEKRWTEGESDFLCFRRLDGKFRVAPTKKVKALMDRKAIGDWDNPTEYPRKAEDVQDYVVYRRPNEAYGQGKDQSAFIWIPAADLEKIGAIYGESSS